jgi:hypothetical protein
MDEKINYTIRKSSSSQVPGIIEAHLLMDYVTKSPHKK